MATRHRHSLVGTRRMAGAFTLTVTAVLAGLSPAGAAAAETETAKPSDNECVFATTITNWRALDSRNLVIWAPNRNDAYHVTLSFPLQDLRVAESMATIDNNGDGRLCGYGMDAIVIDAGPMPERSTILGMTKLDDAALAALADKYKVTLGRPKKDAPAP